VPEAPIAFALETGAGDETRRGAAAEALALTEVGTAGRGELLGRHAKTLVAAAKQTAKSLAHWRAATEIGRGILPQLSSLPSVRDCA
jgi:hypothetical protein